MLRGLGQGFGHRDGSGNIRPGPAMGPGVGTGDIAIDLAQIARDIHALVDHFVLPAYWQKTVVNLASGAALPVSSQKSLLTSIIVNVTTGKLDIYLGSTSSGAPAGTIPDFEVTAIGAPVQLVLPPKAYEFTLVANGATTQGTFIMSSS